MPGGSTREFTFYMEAKSIITRPSNARPVAAQTAKGELGDKLVGGEGTLATPRPVRIVGGYWPCAPRLFDYIHAAERPQSLSNGDVYAVSAYILKI